MDSLHSDSAFRAVVIPPFAAAYSTILDPGIEDLQEVVGGTLAYASRLDLEKEVWCCDEAKPLGMPFCRVLEDAISERPKPFFGQLLVCATEFHPDGGWGFRSLGFDESMDVLASDRLRLPQYLSLKPGDERVHVNLCTDGAGESFYSMLDGGNPGIRDLNRIDGLRGADGITAPPVLVGRPSDMLCGKWRVHIVYPGDPIADDGAPGRLPFVPTASSEELPLVEFWDMSQDRARFPRGQFVSSYYLTTLFDGGFFKEGGAFVLDGGVPSWRIEGGDLRFACQFARQVADACASRPELMASAGDALSPADIARSARSAALSSKVEQASDCPVRHASI